MNFYPQMSIKLWAMSIVVKFLMVTYVPDLLLIAGKGHLVQ